MVTDMLHEPVENDNVTELLQNPQQTIPSHPFREGNGRRQEGRGSEGMKGKGEKWERNGRRWRHGKGAGKEKGGKA